MAKARAIIKRRKAVRNIRKITRTMQLIATARFQKTLQRAMATRPYTTRITEMIETLSEAGTVEHPLLRPNPGITQSILLIITSNRGLCGAYNASVLRTAIEHRRSLAAEGITPELEVVGKKGLAYLRFLGLRVAQSITDVEDRIAYARVAAMAARYIGAYLERRIARVDVAHMRFLSAGVQRPTVARLLPIEAAPVGAPSPRTGRRIHFEFSPPPERLLARLIPEMIRIRLFQFFNDAIVSEQVARMVAMKAATDAAGEMIRYLTRKYNRARQTQITMEIAEIVGGAAAVE